MAGSPMKRMPTGVFLSSLWVALEVHETQCKLNWREMLNIAPRRHPWHLAEVKNVLKDFKFKQEVQLSSSQKFELQREFSFHDPWVSVSAPLHSIRVVRVGLQTSLRTQKQDCIPNKNEEVGPAKAGHAGRAMPVFDKKALKLMEDAGVEILRPLGNAYTKGSEVH